MKKLLFFLSIIFLSSSGFCEYPLNSPRETISEETWAKVYPHLLPEDFEIKERLDQLFNESRATLSSSALERAGFTKTKPRKISHIIVTKHNDFPGYVFKLYLDKENRRSNKRAIHFFLKRIEGALAVQRVIDENSLQNYFKVPKKWIYLMPERPDSKRKYKDFIIVEEDMDLVGKDENRKAWKSQVTKESLAGLYVILNQVGLSDCTRLENIPFSKDGRIAFVDTEATGYEVPFLRLKHKLSGDMKRTWSKIAD